MSGTGKSSALERSRLLGFRTVDTDEGEWTEWSDAEVGYVWREEPMAEPLTDYVPHWSSTANTTTTPSTSGFRSRRTSPHRSAKTHGRTESRHW
jgi:hypothetical protein